MINRFKRALLIRFARLVRAADASLKELEIYFLKDALQSCGVSVSIHPSATIFNPQGLAIGNNVVIGEGAFINAEGGIQIRDNSQLLNHVAIFGCDDSLVDSVTLAAQGPRRSWRQTVIGRDVKIGTAARIQAGVQIGDGAVIGHGALISQDVAPGDTVQQACQVHICRDQIRFSNGAELSCYASAVSKPLVQEPKAAIWPNGRMRHPDIVFVASSGRSGSMSIARWLNRHKRIRGRHEPRLQLVQWSTEYAEGRVDKDETLSRLEDLFLDGTVYDPDVIYVESDQKLYNLMPLLAEILPRARFIWLVRSGYDVVASLVGRGWYAQELDYFQRNEVAWWWNNWRVQGDRTDPPAYDWANMTQFEKCAWYWAHSNAIIEAALKELRVDHTLQTRLEDIERDADTITRFCGVEPRGKRVPVSNAALHGKYDRTKWTELERNAFERWCGPLMRRLYPASSL